MNREYTCFALDDERPALKLITAYVEKIPYLSLINTFENPHKLYESLHETNIDILYLDIQMEDINGIELINLITTRPQIIVTTAFSEYAIKGYDLKVTDYLIKPFSFERFVEATHKAMSQIDLIEAASQSNFIKNSQNNDHFFVRTNNKINKIDFKDIIYIESMREYVSIYTDVRRHIVNMSMVKLMQELPSDYFVRVHRSSIINLSKIEYITGNIVCVSDNMIKIGASYRENFLKRINTL